MPWDSFRRKKDGSKRKDESSLLQQQLYQQHNQRPAVVGAGQATTSSASTSSFASSTVVKGLANQVNASGSGRGCGGPTAGRPSWSSSVLTKEVVEKIREVENETSTLKSGSSQGLSYRIVESK
uniref:Uncharacterized protein n=1 Tax=Romanomermis culicivorax TaxID=13658 RepID=A0A915JIK1_ROMCU